MRINRSSRIALPFAALLALAPLSALAQAGAEQPGQPGQAPPGQPGEVPTGQPLDARAYLSRAGQENLAEIQLAELALKQASSQEVKDLARFLRAEHLLLQDALELALEQVEQKEGLSMPTEPSPVQQETFQRLSRLRGAEFDQAYLEEVERSHQQTISLYQQALNTDMDFDLRAYASTTLPALGSHLTVIREARQRLSQLQ